MRERPPSLLVLEFHRFFLPRFETAFDRMALWRASFFPKVMSRRRPYFGPLKTPIMHLVCDTMHNEKTWIVKCICSRHAARKEPVFHPECSHCQKERRLPISTVRAYEQSAKRRNLPGPAFVVERRGPLQTGIGQKGVAYQMCKLKGFKEEELMPVGHFVKSEFQSLEVPVEPAVQPKCPKEAECCATLEAMQEVSRVCRA